MHRGACLTPVFLAQRTGSLRTGSLLFVPGDTCYFFLPCLLYRVMALSIKDPLADRLAREVAKATGEPPTMAVVHSFWERLARVRRPKGPRLSDDLLKSASYFENNGVVPADVPAIAATIRTLTTDECGRIVAHHAEHPRRDAMNPFMLRLYWWIYRAAPGLVRGTLRYGGKAR